MGEHHVHQTVERLRVMIGAARREGRTLDHVLLHGPPGLGKTTLAMILAAEMGVSIRITAGPAIERTGDLASILTTLQAGDIQYGMVGEGTVDQVKNAGYPVEAKPSLNTVPPLPPGTVLRIPAPGAARSTVSRPRLLKSAGASQDVDAATEMISGTS